MRGSAEPPRRHPTGGEFLLLGSLTAFGAISIDLYLPTLPDIARAFHTSAAAAQLTLSAFFVGMGLGQLFYGPLSDRVGRRPPLLFGCTLYVAASLACALAPSVALLTLGRFIQALGCCAGMVVARAVVRDRYDHRDSARIFSLLTLVLAVAPMLAPTIGAWLALVFSWRAVFLVLAAAGTAIGFSVLFRLDESCSEATRLKARDQHPLHTYAELLTHRRLLGYALVGALNGATLFSYIACAPDIVIDIWGFTPQQFGLIFAAIAVGVIGSSQINRRLLLHHSPDAILGIACLIAVCAGGLLWVVTGLALGKWAVIAALFAALTTNGFINANALAGALNTDPLRAGAISGLFGAAASGVGGLASALASALHDGTPRPLATVIAASLALACLSFFALARPRAEAAG
jgi:DHA1 family bicyclomycin/chloramphenicol resistance-like MFS transporter